MHNIYIGHPLDIYPDSPAELVKFFLTTPGLFPDCQLRPKPYKVDASLNINDFCSTVLQAPGPVVLLQQVQTKTLEGIRSRLGNRLPVLLHSVTSVQELQNVIQDAIAVFTRGEPVVALDVVVALLMMRKLDQEKMWTGNAKGYLWASDIPNGRGLDIKYQPRVANVLNILLNQGIVVYKISNSKKKYALNPDRRRDIYQYLRDRKFPHVIEAPLLRHATMESVRALDLLDCYDIKNA